MKNVFVLPGMDGTGELLAPYADELAARGFAPRVLAYPHDLAQSYAELLDDVVTPALPAGDEPYAVVAESFSGPIALALAQRRPPGLGALVLVVTFATAPRSMLLALTGVLPVDWILSQPIPCWLAHSVMMGRHPPAGDPSALCRVMKQVRPDVLSDRLREVRELRLADDPVDLPGLYIRASEDGRLPPGAVHDVARIVPDLTVRDVAGPHLVLDTHPAPCAELTAAFLAGLSRR